MLDDLPVSIRQNLSRPKVSETEGEGPALKKGQVSFLDDLPLSIRQNLAQKQEAQSSHEESREAKRILILDDLPMSIRQKLSRNVKLVGNARDKEIKWQPLPETEKKRFREAMEKEWGHGNNSK